MIFIKIESLELCEFQQTLESTTEPLEQILESCLSNVQNVEICHWKKKNFRILLDLWVHKLYSSLSTRFISSYKYTFITKLSLLYHETSLSTSFITKLSQFHQPPYHSANFIATQPKKELAMALESTFIFLRFPRNLGPYLIFLRFPSLSFAFLHLPMEDGQNS